MSNACIIPDGPENFDFQTSNSFIQIINDTILQPLTDPYNIGRKVIFDFGNVDAWIAIATGTVLHASDQPTTSVKVFATEAAAAADVISTAALYDYSAGALLGEIRASVEYFRDAHNIVYGSAGNDVLDDTSVSLLYDTAGAPTIFITGTGNDLVSLNLDEDIVKAGDGNDEMNINADYVQVYGGAGGDIIHLHGKGATVFTGDGADIVDLSDNDRQGSLGYIADASNDDSILVDSYFLNGQERATLSYGPEQDVIYESTDGRDIFTLVSVDEKALYSIDHYETEEGSSDTLHISLLNNQQIDVGNYSSGVAQIFADAADYAFSTSDLSPITGGLVADTLATDDNPVSNAFDNFSGTRYLPIEHYTPIDPFGF